MCKVFISGSMRIKNLDNNVLERINNIVGFHYQIIVGDADGVDTSIQSHLFSLNNTHVVVYCSGEEPRNNIGRWEVKRISTDAKPGTRKYFTAKDLKMADDCDYGFMVWDTKSTGTLSNAIELLKRNKSSLIYINKIKEFFKVKEVNDLENLIEYMSVSAREKAESKIGLNKTIELLKNEQGSLF